jgi:hypothetical protein
MNRRISHGQAMRSILGRSRVTQRLGAAAAGSTWAVFVMVVPPAAT